MNEAKRVNRLPRWADPEAMRNRDEAKLAPYRAMTPEQRLEISVKACALAMAVLEFHEDPGKILRFRGSIPESSRKLMARLRMGYQWHAPR